MKKKLRMDLRELRIETFESVKEPEPPRGTVRGYDSWGCSASCYSCEPPKTCGGNTCQFESCDRICESWLCTP